MQTLGFNTPEQLIFLVVNLGGWSRSPTLLTLDSTYKGQINPESKEMETAGTAKDKHYIFQN